MLPDDVLNIIETYAMGRLHRENLAIILKELTLSKTTKTNMFGCIFLNLTNSLSELENVEYSYEHIERLPSLEHL